MKNLRDLLHRARLTPPAAGAWIGAVVAVADSVHVYRRWHWEELGSRDVPPYTFVTLLWIWVTVGILTGMLFSATRLGRARAIPLMLAGPGILAAGRGTSWIRGYLSVGDDATAIVIGLVAALLLSVPLAIIGFRETTVRPLPLLATLVSFAAVVYCGVDPPFSTALSSRSHGNDPAKRNVVLVFLDTVRYSDALGTAGVATHLQAAARRGVLFSNAWAPAPWTLPTHHAVLTGIDPWAAKYDAENFRYVRSAPLLSEHFRSRGYTTGAVFANTLLAPDANFAHGFDEFTFTRGSRTCHSGVAMLVTRTLGVAYSPFCGWIRAPEVTERALGFVARARRPYFLAVNYLDAHAPYPVSRDCDAIRTRPLAERDVDRLHSPVFGPSDPAVLRRGHDQYRAAIRCLDRALGPLLTKLADDDHTIIAIVADHGEQFGEHGLTSHGNSVYRQALHVPLILSGPSLAPGTVDDPVSITDLHRSLRELAEPGRQRRPVTLLDARFRRPVISSYEMNAGSGGSLAAFSVVDRDHHFIHWSNGTEALFNYTADPEERTPVAVREHALTVERLRELTRGAARSGSEAAAQFDALGYLARTK